MKQKLSIFMVLCLSAFLFASSPVVKLTGTVTKTGGGPLKDVTLTLKKLSNASGVTDAAGKFVVIPTQVLRMTSPEVAPLEFNLKGSVFVFSPVSGKISGTVDVFSANGKKTFSSTFNSLEPATQSVSLPAFGSGLNIVRISLNGKTYTCPILRVGKSLYFKDGSTNATADGNFTLAKVAAAAPVDTLIARKAGFTDKLTPVKAYVDSNLSIAMDSASSSGYPENPGAGCNVSAGEYGAVDNPKLPNPFKMHDGTIISSMAEWQCRRAQIIKDIEKFEVGPRPPPSDVKVTATFSDGTLKVTVTSKDGSLTMNNKVSGSGKCVVIGFGGGGSMVNGCQTIAFNHAAIAKDGMTGAASQTDGYYKVFPHLWKKPAAGNEGNEIVGNYGAWSWGVSRMIDGMEQVKDAMGIDMSKISIHGCSWAGKGALWAGALDARIALTVAQECGGGGVAAWRISDDIEEKTGKEVEDLDNTGWSWFIDWLLDPYIEVGGVGSGGGKKPHLLPHDHHELLALIAPRAVIVLPGNSTSHLAAPSAYASFMAARQVWKAMGIEDRAGLVTHSGTHCSASTAQQTATNKFVNRFLKGGTDNTNIVDPAGATYDWEQYVDWKTPTIPYP